MTDQDRILVGGILLREHHLDKIARFLNFKQDCPGDAVLDIVNAMRGTLTIDWMAPHSPPDECILVIVVQGRGPPGANLPRLELPAKKVVDWVLRNSEGISEEELEWHTYVYTRRAANLD